MVIVTAVRCGLAMALAVTAAGKVRGFRAFRGSLAGYGLHGGVAWGAALAVIGAEGGTAAIALLPGWGLLAGVLGTGLGAVFLAAQVYALAAGGGATCVCLGRVEQVSARTVSRAALVLVAGLLLLVAGWPGA
jgi:hypothetical protein